MIKGKNKMITGKEKNTKKKFFFPEKQITVEAKNYEEALKIYKSLINKK